MNDEINRLAEELKFKGMAGVMEQQVALAESGSPVQDIICNLLREEFIGSAIFFHQNNGISIR